MSEREDAREVIVLMDPEGGRPQSLNPVTFSELGVNERRDLEKWVMENTHILGEDLLIITSEYDKFDKSDKRLDVLALDRDGKVVVIELKRDASKSLADLQAIRYAAFCSTIVLADVVKLRAEYASIGPDRAMQEVREFVEDPEFSSIGNKPRIILAAGSFDDQELTSCVLWLNSFGLDITCVEITPYKVPHEKRIILVPRVIIPLPETKKYTVGIQIKEAKQEGLSALGKVYRERNEQILRHFREFMPMRAPKQAWAERIMQIPTKHSKVHYEWWQRRDRVLHVAIHFETGNGEWNRRVCNFLREQDQLIKEALGEPPTYEPNWSRVWSAVYLRKPCEEWSDDIARWAAQTMYKLIPVVDPLVDKYYEMHEGAQ